MATTVCLSFSWIRYPFVCETSRERGGRERGREREREREGERERGLLTYMYMYNVYTCTCTLHVVSSSSYTCNCSSSVLHVWCNGLHCGVNIHMYHLLCEGLDLCLSVLSTKRDVSMLRVQGHGRYGSTSEVLQLQRQKTRW